jgi:hypothetical protein
VDVDNGVIEIKLPDLSRVALEPGDVLLVRCGTLSAPEARLVKLRLSQVFPGHEIVLISSEVEVSVVRLLKSKAE